LEVVVVGGGYAGVSCALRLAHRARAQGTPVRIRVINPMDGFVERIRTHQAASGQHLRRRPMGRLLERAGAELVVGKALRIDIGRHTVETERGALRWDRLVLAAGSRSASPSSVPGVKEHALGMDPWAADVLLQRLRALPAGAEVAVVGGGLTGIEAASEFAESFPHLRVHLVAGDAVADGFSPRARDHVVTVLSRLGVQLHEHVDVQSVHATGLHTNAGTIGSDLCVWAAGFSLSALPRDAGLPVAANGQVLVDPCLRSIANPFIYAAGDIATPVLAPGQDVPMGCKTAMPMGAMVGDNLACELRGDATRPFDYALLFYCVSLGRRDGVIQWADDGGALTGRVLTGRRAALFKELICRSTWWALRLEAMGFKGVVWKQTGNAPERLPGDLLL
jgi:NADH dehydrogenase FAD-containing subunit